MAPKSSKKKASKTTATATATAKTGKTKKSKKRAERIAKASPYQTKSKRKDKDEEVVEVEKVEEVVETVKDEDVEAEEAVEEKVENEKEDEKMEEEPPLKCRVFVRNLSWTTNAVDLKEHMKAAGPVESVHLHTLNGQSAGRGTVTFETEEGAKNAIATLQDSELRGRKITIREDRQAQRPQRPQRKYGPRIFVGNLANTVRWMDLKKHMKRAGRVVHADIMEAPGGCSMGSGFVQYTLDVDPAKVIAEMNDSMLAGRRLIVHEDKSGEVSINQLTRGVRDTRGRQVYVGPLPPNMHRKKLKKIFMAFGQVERADVIEDKIGRHPGFGIVRFVTPAGASKAIDNVNATEIEGNVVRVRYDFKSK